MLNVDLFVFAILFRGGIYPVDLDGRVIFDFEALAAVVADLIWVEIADLAFHAVIAFLCFV